MKPGRFFKIAVINLLTVSALLFAIEYGALYYNRGTPDGARPFLFDGAEWRGREPGVRQVGGTTKMSFIDPHLGHAHDPSADLNLQDGLAAPGFIVYGDASDADAIRIVSLGGSTTDPLDRGNWPKALAKELSANDLKAVVYNGGVSGYSSNQELLKLIRDVLPLEPDIVVSLNGINDMAFMHSVQGHPMVHPYQRRLFESVVAKPSPIYFPNTTAILRRLVESATPELYRIEGVNYGTKTDVSPQDQWARNVRLMHAVSSEFGVEYLCFLQPTLGIGDYNPTPDEEALLLQAEQERGGTYIRRVESFYGDARRTCGELPYTEDYTDLFHGASGLYRDARHPNADGYALIAKAILSDLELRGTLEDVAKRRAVLQYRRLMTRIRSRYEAYVEVIPSSASNPENSGGVVREDRFGWSLPIPNRAIVVHYSSGDFFAQGWYISDRSQVVEVQLNWVSYPAKYGIRRDVEEKYPEYPYKVGWTVRVPVEALNETNDLKLFLGRREQFTVQLDLPSE